MLTQTIEATTSILAAFTEQHILANWRYQHCGELLSYTKLRRVRHSLTGNDVVII